MGTQGTGRGGESAELPAMSQLLLFSRFNFSQAFALPDEGEFFLVVNSTEMRQTGQCLLF